MDEGFLKKRNPFHLSVLVAALSACWESRLKNEKTEVRRRNRGFYTQRPAAWGGGGVVLTLLEKLRRTQLPSPTFSLRRDVFASILQRDATAAQNAEIVESFC